MDKSAFFDALALKSVTERVPGTDMEITLCELSAGAREDLFDRCKGKGPHYIAAVTVALSCPDFSLDDVEKLLTSVNAEALMSLSARVFELSGVTEDSVEEEKKG